MFARRAARSLKQRAQLAGVVSSPAVTHRLDRASPRNGAKTARRSPALRLRGRGRNPLYAATAHEIRALGASLVAISPQTAPNRRKSERENALSFPILSDHGNSVANEFGLRYRLPDDLIAVYKGFGNDLAIGNGEDSWTLPMPARYVIGADGVIAYAEVNPDYTRRPDPSELLPVLRRLRTVAAA
jgi:peroxiredoxin